VTPRSVRRPLADSVLHLIEGLSLGWGRSFATERAKREKMAEDGRRVGERSIGRVERKLAREGILERKRIYPGDRLPTGKQATHSTVLVRIRSRQELRAMDRAARKAERRKPASPPAAPPRVREPCPEYTREELAAPVDWTSWKAASWAKTPDG
jgi:hypothetical protein